MCNVLVNSLLLSQLLLPFAKINKMAARRAAVWRTMASRDSLQLKYTAGTVRGVQNAYSCTFLSTGTKRALVVWRLPLVTARSPSTRRDPQYCFSRQCRRMMPTTRPHGCFAPDPFSFRVFSSSSMSGCAVNSGTRFSVGLLSSMPPSPLAASS